MSDEGESTESRARRLTTTMARFGLAARQVVDAINDAREAIQAHNDRLNGLTPAMEWSHHSGLSTFPQPPDIQPHEVRTADDLLRFSAQSQWRMTGTTTLHAHIEYEFTNTHRDEQVRFILRGEAVTLQSHIVTERAEPFIRWDTLPSVPSAKTDRKWLQYNRYFGFYKGLTERINSGTIQINDDTSLSYQDRHKLGLPVALWEVASPEFKRYWQGLNNRRDWIDWKVTITMRDRDKYGTLLAVNLIAGMGLAMPQHVDMMETELALVWVVDPSSGTNHVLSVPTTVNSAREAVAWTFGVHADLLDKISQHT